MNKLTELLKTINRKINNENYINKDNQDDYVPFVVNRIFSYFPDTLFIASNMNKRPRLDKDMQFKYYYYSVSNRYRYSQLVKMEDDKFFHTLAEKYGISKKSARKNYMCFKGEYK